MPFHLSFKSCIFSYVVIEIHIPIVTESESDFRSFIGMKSHRKLSRETFRRSIFSCRLFGIVFSYFRFSSGRKMPVSLEMHLQALGKAAKHDTPLRVHLTTIYDGMTYERISYFCWKWCSLERMIVLLHTSKYVLQLTS